MVSLSCRFLLWVGLLAWVAGVGLSAAPQPPQSAPPSTSGVTAGAEVRRIRGVEGVPYSADEVSVTTRMLADGTTITQQHRRKLYRDSEGRTREEIVRPASARQVESGQRDDVPVFVHIVDPVAGVYYTLNPRTHTAQKTEIKHPTPLRPRPPETTAASATRPPERPRPDVEDLGSQEIEGVTAKGTRVTHIIPAGTDGNDRPMEFIQENWYSPELQLMIMRAVKHPMVEETVTRLTNIVRDEPPAELFQIPSDYTLEELQPVEKPPAANE